MSGLLFLVDKCSTKRRGREAQPYGGKPQYLERPLTDAPCRLKTKTERGFNSITAEWVVTTDYELHLQADADIREGDRVNITLQDGTVIPENLEVDGGAIQRRGRMDQIKLVSLKKVS